MRQERFPRGDHERDNAVGGRNQRREVGFDGENATRLPGGVSTKDVSSLQRCCGRCEEEGGGQESGGMDEVINKAGAWMVR